jgi:two-component system, OmpR family, sensor kinase
MKNSRTLIVGFLSVVVLLTSSAGYSLWSTKQTAEGIDVLVKDSLERERLIGLMRLDSALLIKAADDHINAIDFVEQSSADSAMDVLLTEIKNISTQFSAGPTQTDIDLWNKLNVTATALVKKVDVTIKASKRAEAERAKRHLEEEAKPLSFELDATAEQLAKRNELDTRSLLSVLQNVRYQANLVATGVIGMALLLSLLVAWQVLRLLRRQEKTIAHQLVQLGQRNQDLDAFASRVTHDLMAPLAPLKGYLTLARRSVADPVSKELIEQAESSTQRMSALVDGLSRFSRALEPAPQEKRTGEFDVAVTSILLEQSQLAEKNSLSLSREIAQSVTVQCPGQLLQSIAQNVIGNALKYTVGTPQGSIRVSLKASENFGVLVVSDNGPGVSSESQTHLFQPFFRAPENRAVPGTGLGLATTKRLVEAHGGTIEFNSQSGSGTTVTVSLPLVKGPTS